MIHWKLIIFRSIIYGLLTEAVTIIEQALLSIRNFKIVVQSVIGFFQNCLEIVVELALHNLSHRNFREIHRSLSAGTISVEKGYLRKISVRRAQPDCHMFFIRSICIF